MTLSIIIPVFNEEKTIREILERVDKVKLDGLKREIIVVDDGSRDNTTAELASIEKHVKDLTVIRHKRNKGKGAAVQTGFKHASGDILIIQDADLEYNPNDIPKLIKPIIEGRAQAVYGTRLRMAPVLFGKNRTPLLLHFFGNKFLSAITSVLYGRTITDMETCYKAINKGVLKDIKLKSRSFDFEPEITAKILKKGVRIHEIDIRTKPRGYGEGKKLHTFRDGFRALWTLVKYRFVN